VDGFFGMTYMMSDGNENWHFDWKEFIQYRYLGVTGYRCNKEQFGYSKNTGQSSDEDRH
jgi:nuclear transport factor 2 (NTF2) superfamily protein